MISKSQILFLFSILFVLSVPVQVYGISTFLKRKIKSLINKVEKSVNLWFIFKLQCQYDNNRCKCICPNPQVVTNSTDANSTQPSFNNSSSNRKLYINNVVREQDKW